MSNTTKVSLVIPTYCPDQEVEDCLKRFTESLIKYTNRDDYQLIIVEQGNQFWDIEKLHPDEHYYKENPIGYARAVNLGMAAADGDLIVVLNNDLELCEGWLDRLVEDYHNYFSDEGLLSACDSDRNIQGIAENESWYSLFIISKKTWQKIGYFDETLNYRFHDQDYSIKLKKAGLKVGRTGNVIVRHKDATTFKKMHIDETNEKGIMMQRHGAILFSDWLNK